MKTATMPWQQSSLSLGFHCDAKSFSIPATCQVYTALPKVYMFSFLSSRRCQSQHSQRRGEEDVGGALAKLAAVKGVGDSPALRAFSLPGAHVSSLNPQDNPKR